MFFYVILADMKQPSEATNKRRHLCISVKPSLHRCDGRNKFLPLAILLTSSSIFREPLVWSVKELREEKWVALKSPNERNILLILGDPTAVSTEAIFPKVR